MTDILDLFLEGFARSNPYFPATIMNSSSVRTYSTDTECTIELDAPGYKVSELEVKVDGGVLSVKGQRGVQIADGAKMLSGSNRHTISRSWTLPRGAQAIAGAVLKDGVLKITVPLTTPQSTVIVPISLG